MQGGNYNYKCPTGLRRQSPCRYRALRLEEGGDLGVVGGVLGGLSVTSLDGFVSSLRDQELDHINVV